ncbi:hypothetical protein [Scleromatobacter humisilvae]|uniref:Uncharacterized protein n=1 Tax=Scleromatobacter humisilvae TaxID=2897159 RepID=A0A9X2C102_9BURK|nr:hypothetical protein [Scleromatobacter humisilvae]MCK9687061.1 hypothetical protein [Scleromatobacter humisilvae]
MTLRLRWSTATIGAGIAVAALATWLLASGPKCGPGSDWPRSWAQAVALKDAWQRESVCRQPDAQCSYRIETAAAGDITVTVQVTGVDDAGLCIVATDNQRHYHYAPSGAPAASSPH